MIKDCFKSYKATARLDIDALLNIVEIRKHIMFSSFLDFYSKEKFTAKYDKHNNLLLVYKVWLGSFYIPLTIISEKENGLYDIEIKRSNLQKIINALCFLMAVFFFIVGIIINEKLIAVFALFLLAFFIVLECWSFNRIKKYIKEELDNFITDEEK